MAERIPALVASLTKDARDRPRRIDRWDGVSVGKYFVYRPQLDGARPGFFNRTDAWVRSIEIRHATSMDRRDMIIRPFWRSLVIGAP